MSASRAQALSSRAPFNRGGLFFTATHVAVEIPGDHPLVDLLAILREPVLTIQVDNDGDGVFVTMRPEAREAAIENLAAQLADPEAYVARMVARMKALNTPEEPPLVAVDTLVGGDGGPGITTTEGQTLLEAAIDAQVQADAVTTATAEPASQPAASAAVAPPAPPAPPAVEAVRAKPEKPPRAPKAPKAGNPADPPTGQ